MDSLQSYLVVSAILFSLGMYGIMTRKNAIAILMGIELILNSANINFIALKTFSSIKSIFLVTTRYYLFLYLNILLSINLYVE